MTDGPTIDPNMSIGSVNLAVSDLSQSLGFYSHILGLHILSDDGARATLGSGREGPPILTLTRLERPTSIPLGTTGLFHVAFLHPTRRSLADTVIAIITAEWPIDGASDHGVSEAVYLSDPDGLGIEIYVDRPRATWQRTPGQTGVAMFTLPLDLDDLLTHRSGPDRTRSVTEEPTMVTVGHVHLKVSDVSRSVHFYRDLVGLAEQARLPSASFLSAGGYHHHIGVNSWQSAGGQRPPASAPDLREIGLQLSDQRELDALRARLEGSQSQAGHGGTHATAVDDDQRPRTDTILTVDDPDGHRLVFSDR